MRTIAVRIFIVYKIIRDVCSSRQRLKATPNLGAVQPRVRSCTGFVFRQFTLKARPGNMPGRLS